MAHAYPEIDIKIFQTLLCKNISLEESFLCTIAFYFLSKYLHWLGHAIKLLRPEGIFRDQCQRPGEHRVGEKEEVLEGWSSGSNPYPGTGNKGASVYRELTN